MAHDDLRALHPHRRAMMAKGQMKSNKETRKPKAPAPKKVSQANPSTK
jgi:hypothetical protein